MKFHTLLLSFFLLATAAHAEDSPLDPPYKTKHLLIRDLGFESLNRLPPQSNIKNVIEAQTSVKAQVSRGTCSIFSAVALLESQLISVKNLPVTLDLSEEWLEYLAVRGRTTDGSNSESNFFFLKKHGIPDEVDMPYIGEAWTNLETTGLMNNRCGHLEERKLKSCLITHWDPDFLYMNEIELQEKSPEFAKARSFAGSFRDNFIDYANDDYTIKNESEAKKLLADGTPIILDLDFYYGAWNHRLAPDVGVERNMDDWHNGIVGYPEIGSVDRKNSPNEAAGHSIVVVGYDDKKVVETEVLMTDGTMKKFKHVGVYYLKNSWGTGGFGKNFSFEGNAHPGFGMITQDYAHEFGSFFKLPLK